MWDVVDNNMPLESTCVKEEVESSNDLNECVKTEPSSGAELSTVIKQENGQSSELIQPPDPYLHPCLEVTVKIEEEGRSCNEKQLLCKREMKSPKLIEDCTIIRESMERKTGLQFIVLRDCFVRLERMSLYKKIYTCTVCQKKLNSKQSLKSHLLCHTEEKSKLRMKTMKKTTEQRDKQETKLCKTCGKPLARLIKTLKTRENSCMCKRNYKAKCNLINKSKNDLVEKPFQCYDCGKCFKSNYLLTNHKRIHTGEKPYSCPICNKPFSELVNQKRHERSHTGERPYCCNICNKQFSLKANLDIHIRIHTQEKPFTCDFCDKPFAHSSDLKKHERVHTGEKPFACDICQISFRRKYLLVDHLRIHSKKLD